MIASRPEEGRGSGRLQWPSRGEPPWIIAHRGASAIAPENTLEAAELGFQAGADAWELDVHVSRDGVPVVIHDESLRRTTDVSSRFRGDPRGASGFLVADFDAEEIRSLDAGSWFLDPDGGPRSAAAFGTLGTIAPGRRRLYGSGEVRVPTLAEALAWTVRCGWRVNVELKSVPTADPRLVGAVLAAIEAAGAWPHAWISSFDHEEIARALRDRPGLAAGVLSATPLYRPAEYVRDRIGAGAYHPSADAVGARSTAYRRAPSAEGLRLGAATDSELPVFVFTVNDPALAAHLAAAGASGLFTDDPASVRGAR